MLLFLTKRKMKEPTLPLLRPPREELKCKMCHGNIYERCLNYITKLNECKASAAAFHATELTACINKEWKCFQFLTLPFWSFTKGIHFNLSGINFQEKIIQLLNLISCLYLIKRFTVNIQKSKSYCFQSKGKPILIIFNVLNCTLDLYNNCFYFCFPNHIYVAFKTALTKHHDTA